MTNDMTKMMQDMMGAFPMDTSAMQDAFKAQAQLAERLSRAALDAAEQSTEISSTWTKDTLTKMRDVTTLKDEPADYSKAVSELASAQAETTAETMARFAEVAKKLQMQTVELMLSAGKEMAEDTAAQSGAVAARSRQAATEMSARSQEMAAKTKDTMGKMAEQGREAGQSMTVSTKDNAGTAADAGAEAAKAASASAKRTAATAK